MSDSVSIHIIEIAEDVTIMSDLHTESVQIDMVETTGAISINAQVVTEQIDISVLESVDRFDIKAVDLASLTVAREDSFNSIIHNLKDYDVISTSYDGATLTKTWDTGNGTSIVSTLTFQNGLPFTKVLSGSGLPFGIKTVLTYDWTGGTDKPPLKTYS